MENQQKHQPSTSAAQAKQGKDGKYLPLAGLGLGIIATAFAIIWLTLFADASSTRPSTTSEIAAQKEFQVKWNTEKKEAEKKWELILKAAERN